MFTRSFVLQSVLATALIAAIGCTDRRSSGLGQATPANTMPSARGPVSEPAPSLAELERLQALENVKEQLGALKQMTAKISQERHLDCLRAIGHPQLCSCLDNELPLISSFQHYVTVVTRSKDEIGYATLDDETKKVVDRILIVRDECVARVFAK